MDIKLIIPFCKDAKEMANELNLNVDNPENLNLIKLFLKGIFEKNFEFPKIDSKFLKDYFALYPYSRIILSYLNKDRFYDSFSNFYYLLAKKEIKDFDEALKLLEINYEKTNEFYLIPFEEYIKAKIFSEKDKLINQSLNNGKVILTKDKTLNFISRYISARVLENLPLNVKQTSKKFKIISEELDLLFKPKIDYKNIKFGKTNFDFFAPCMSKILATMLEKGNPSHYERYYFATFCFSIKMPFEDVLNLFKNTSDYDDKIARYQLKKIENYSCPNCETIKSMGYCYPDDFCQTIKSPLHYYKKKYSISRKFDKTINNESKNENTNKIEENKT